MLNPGAAPGGALRGGLGCQRGRQAEIDDRERYRQGAALSCCVTSREKNVCVVFLRCAGEAGERLPLGKSVQLCAYLLSVGALAARLSDG